MRRQPQRTCQVFGPAYLDRVLRVDRPLHDPGTGSPLDQSVEGRWRFDSGAGLALVDRDGGRIGIELPDDWPGPFGDVELADPLRRSPTGAAENRFVRAIAWQDDLGGMGAGYASALDARLVSALGDEDDPFTRIIERLLALHGIRHQAVRIAGQPADWTLLVTSGPHGDKLPIGFRGCHAALRETDLIGLIEPSSDLRAVASLPNPLASALLREPGARVRFFAPTLRNMRDASFPVSRFAGSIDVLSCNRREWESLADREEVAWRVSVLSITDGPQGSLVRFTMPDGEPGYIEVPAFPRDQPPRDTNRAGEAYAATLINSLLDLGWEPGAGVVEEELVRTSAVRASAAAALVLDRLDFGFPTPVEIDQALRAGRIEAPHPAASATPPVQ